MITYYCAPIFNVINADVAEDDAAPDPTDDSSGEIVGPV